MSAQTPWQALTASVARDNASPRVTFYERTPGPTHGERIELSGKVLLNWVSKAANMLTEEFDVEPGTRVALHIPAQHWRTQYWALAVWACGGSVLFSDCEQGESPAEADVLITCCPVAGVADQIVVTLPALARAASEAVPSGAFDEAKEISTYSDVFTPFQQPSADDLAYRGRDGELTFAQLLADATSKRAYLQDPTLGQVFAHLAGDSGVVLIRGAHEDVSHLLAQEGLQ